MINKPDGLDNKVEAVLITTMSGDELVKVAHGVYLTRDRFASVRPVGDDPEHLAALKTLRTQLVEERLAAAEARSKTALTQGVVNRLDAEIGRLRRDDARVARSHRLAVEALRQLRIGHLSEERSHLFDLLLGTDGKPGSIAEPCNADLSVNRRCPGCGCETPCLEEVGAHPCALRRGHLLVLGKHVTLYGREFDTGEHVIADDEDGD